METFFNNTFAFIVALGLLVTVHEFGHFIVARFFGVKVLRFSIGFGTPIWRRQFSPGGTEYVLAILPLGGYVKMLDEREGEVAPEELHQAFNRKPVLSRMAVVLAGPMFNFLFAILAYWFMFVVGVSGTKPIVNDVVVDSIAYRAGMRVGDVIVDVDGDAVPSWEVARSDLVAAALAERTAVLRVRSEGGLEVEREIDLSGTMAWVEEGDFLFKVGIDQWPKKIEAVIGTVVPGQAAAQAGLMTGDRILQVNGEAIADWKAWVAAIRENPGKALKVSIGRGAETRELLLTPVPSRQADGQVIGKIGAGAKPLEDMRITWRYDALNAVGKAVSATYSMASSTLRMLGKMLIGDASMKNISGPIKIAEVAGESASLGYMAFVQFLALISISLGVLNLLPVPILDGGHLLYYVVEFFTGRPVSEKVQIIGQRIGMIIIVLLMGVAFFNDLSGLFSKGLP